jgi:hypothetical protein
VNPVALGRVGSHPLRPDEAGIRVERGRGRVVGLPADPDALAAEVDEAAKARREEVAREAAALVVVLGAHRFHESDPRDGVVPAVRVAGALLRLGDDQEVEVGTVERRLAEAVLDGRTVASAERVRSVGAVGSAVKVVAVRARPAVMKTGYPAMTLLDGVNLMAERTPAKKPPRDPRRTGEASSPEQPVLLSGGNPQIAKGDGDAPVQAYIAAMPGWKQGVGRRLDALIVRTVPDVRKAVRWNSPFYGVEGQGWFVSYHCFTKYVKVTFLRGAHLEPLPPVASKDPNTRYVHIFERESPDDELLERWFEQAAAMPGDPLF